MKGLLKADFSGISDPVGDILDGLNKFADFRSAPDIGGLGGKTRGLSHYFPDLSAPVSAPTGHDFIAASLKSLQVLIRLLQKHYRCPFLHQVQITRLPMHMRLILQLRLEFKELTIC